MSYDLNYPTAKKGGKKVSIPLEQGSVLRLNEKQRRGQFPKSQSLWNRAVSYDGVDRLCATASGVSQSLWNRAVSYDRSRLSTL